MNKIGGFFELELERGNSVIHETARAFSTGRACLNLILTTLKPSKVFVPFYSCDSLLEAIRVNNIDIQFYKINSDLEIENLPQLDAEDLLIGINFFGIKNEYIRSLSEIYGNKLIVDNSHAFFNSNYSRIIVIVNST